MSYPHEAMTATRALRNAAPYMRLYKGKAFVVKVGGALLEDRAAARSFMEQVAILHQLGIRVVLVHGGGPQLTALQRRLGVEPRIIDGRRVTDQRSLELSVMALNGLINTELLALCRALELPAVGLSGVAGGLVHARRRPPVRTASGELIDYGEVGDVFSIAPEVLEKTLAAGYMPVVSPVSATDEGALLNVNADTVAAAIGAGLAAEKLILCTGAAGIFERLEDPRSLISMTDIAGLARLQSEGCLADGMLPKATAIKLAIRGGVRRVHVISYRGADALLGEVFTNEGTGTLIVADAHALTPAEQAGVFAS
jgi:acetylglutamate kinase